MKFVYPVDINDRDDADAKYLKGVSNRTGYYPVGRMNTWHGGVYFQGGRPLRVIADGKIIAFRVPRSYHREVVDGREGQYSNGFVLVQHDYESPKGQKLTFYALYNHLTSFDEMMGTKIPDLFKGEIYKVRKDVKDTIDTIGVRIRQSPQDGEIIGVAAKGTTLTVLGNSTGVDWIRVRYTTPLGKTLIGHTFAGKYGAKQGVDLNSGKVLVEVASGSTGDVGARLRKEPNVSGDILALIPPEEALEIAPEYIGKTGWLKVVNYGAGKIEGYCHDSSLEKEVIVTLKEELCDKVNNVCMEVKAGTIIGFAGLNGFEKNEPYRAAHMEVYTTDDVKDFLANSQKDGEDKKHYTKLAAGTELKVSLPFQVVKNSKVKLLSGSSDHYQQVEVVNIEVTVNNRNEALGEYNSSRNNYEFLPSQSGRVDAFNKVAGDIAKVGDKVELIEQLEGKRRKVRHLNPASGQVFWVKREMIEKKVITYTVPHESGTETIEYEVINADLTEVHLLNPETNDKAGRTLESEVVVHYRNGTEYSDADGKKWYFLNFIELNPNGVACNYKGLVKEESLADRFSAYNWDQFGFRVLDDANNSNIFDLDNKSEFFTEICKLVYKDKNGLLEPHELQSALNNHHTADKLSKLVCKHHSEWACGGDYFSSIPITNPVVYRFHPEAFVEGMKRMEEFPSCGAEFRNEIACTRYGSHYGPVFWGTKNLSDFSNWDAMVARGVINSDEKLIIVGMSENEGKLDAVQSYDSEIATVGAMQKTINRNGFGEFPIQMAEFKHSHPNKFEMLFKNCGWDVQLVANKWQAVFQGKTGSELKAQIRKGFSVDSFRKKVESRPLEPLINAACDIDFQEKQILDFIHRLNNIVLEIRPLGYPHQIKAYVKSNLGKAVVLDHHVNRPAYVKADFGAALDIFFNKNPLVSKDPANWTKHSNYETEILETYGISRRGTDMVNRFNKLKKNYSDLSV